MPLIMKPKLSNAPISVTLPAETWIIVLFVLSQDESGYLTEVADQIQNVLQS